MKNDGQNVSKMIFWNQ